MSQNLTLSAMDIQEGIPITDAPAILATLYPALLVLARKELTKRGDNSTEAEDLVQGAVTSWLEVIATQDAAYGYMRNLIRNRARDRQRERHLLSLDQLTEAR